MANIHKRSGNSAKAKSASAKSAKANSPRRLPAGLMTNIHKRSGNSAKANSAKANSAKANSSKAKSVKPETPTKESYRRGPNAFLLEIADPNKGVKLLKKGDRSDNFKKDLETYRDLVGKTISSVKSDLDSSQEEIEKKRIIKFLNKIRIERVSPTDKNILKYKATIVRYVDEYLKLLEKNGKLTTSFKTQVTRTLSDLIKGDSNTNLSVIYFGLKTKSISKLIKKSEDANNSNNDWNTVSQSNRTTKNSNVELNVSAMSESE
tara:strand:+ start:230 stop:1018 length:789 start_codon:yes stop_codon:yes gene_type:complete